MNDFSLNALPTTIIKYEIAPYVPNNYLTYTNTEHYEKNAAMYREKLKTKYKKYLLFIIKNDLNYCLKIQIRHQNNFFNKQQKINYNNKRFSCIYGYLQYLCDLYSSEKCKQLIKDKIHLKLNKKYKKYRTYNNKWSN